MCPASKTPSQVADENRRLRTEIAQLEDRLEHVTNPSSSATSADSVSDKIRELEDLHRVTVGALSDVSLITDDSGRLTFVGPNVHLVFGHSILDVYRSGRIEFLLPSQLFQADLLEERGEIPNIECAIRDSIGRTRNLLVSVKKSKPSSRFDTVHVP